MDRYPQTVAEVLDDNIVYPPAVIEAVEEFKESHPWRGSLRARKRKFRVLNARLASIYGIAAPDLRFGQINGSSSGGSFYIPALHRITLVGRLSVVTALHEFGHALGMNERNAARWSINLFRRCFPEEYSRLVHVGHCLIRREEVGR